ncbi:hypothetical protein DFJ73DRAFT_798006 [Zopfochytrium polystomum]|nr:hypothetical protein DFJ73DRAFT_798006 [Zopfochytrium polystomum]
MSNSRSARRGGESLVEESNLDDDVDEDDEGDDADDEGGAKRRSGEQVARKYSLAASAKQDGDAHRKPRPISTLSGDRLTQQAATLHRLLTEQDASAATDDVLINIIAPKSFEEAESLSAHYLEKYKTSLATSLMPAGLTEVATGWWFRKALATLTLGRIELTAVSLEEAMKGIGCDENTIVEIILETPFEDLPQLQSTYAALYHKDLVKTLTSELRAPLRPLLLPRFSTATPSDPSDAATLAALLASLDENTNPSAALAVFCATRETSHLRELFAHPAVAPAAAAAAAHLPDSYRSALLTPHCHAARLFLDAMKGAGHHHGKLVRLVARWGRDVEGVRAVKRAYREIDGTDGETLYERIRSEAKGAYQRCLLEVVQP